MKKFILITITCIYSIASFAQLNTAEDWAYNQIEKETIITKDDNYDINGCDIKDVIMHTQNDIIVGFIGNNYQRIRIRFTKVLQDTKRKHIYSVAGKSLVKNNLVSFIGTITIQSFAKIKKGEKESNIAVVKYKLVEDKTQKFAGVFEGFGVLNFNCQAGAGVYNDDEQDADGFYNNQFVGTWTSNATKAAKPCHWGDYRIPNCGDLDVGAGEFVPNTNYLQYGWQGYFNAFINTSELDLAIENKKWWVEKTPSKMQ